jgi:two-component system NtrC family response regulator
MDPDQPESQSLRVDTGFVREIGRCANCRACTVVTTERILILDADTAQRAELASSLRGEGFEVVEAATAEAAIEVLRSMPVQGVLCAARASGWSCTAVTSLARAAGSDAAFVATCRKENLAAGIEALRNGADAYVVLPADTVRPGVVLQRALEKRRLRREARELRELARSRLRWVGTASESVSVDEIIRRAAPTKATVLLQGEAGTGRSFVAEMIHEASPRRDRTFARTGCAGLSETLLEAMLFGSEGVGRGEVPRRHEGLLERADGGTLYLHEVGSLGPALQVKLLRLLQQGEYERVGSSRTMRADVRVVASTRLDLGEEVRAGRFRDDLYYRLNVVSLALPPLRARKADIPALASHFLTLHGRERGKALRGLTPGALSALFAYDWPGNVRELENAMTQAAEVCTADMVGIDDLPTVLRGARPDEEAGSALIPGASLFEIEREAILRTLDAVGGSTARAAEVLGVSVRKIQYRLKEYRTGQPVSRVRAAEA